MRPLSALQGGEGQGEVGRPFGPHRAGRGCTVRKLLNPRLAFEPCPDHPQRSVSAWESINGCEIHPRRDRRRRNLHRSPGFRDRRRHRRGRRPQREDRHHPRRLRGRRVRRHGEGGRRGGLGGLPRPRHDGGHQRADRAHRRQGRPHHDAGVSRHAGDRARQPARLLQPALSKARALRAAQPAPRAARPHRLPRAGDAPRRSLTAAGDRRGFSGRRRGGGRHLLHPRLREPRARASRSRRAQPALAGGLRHLIPPDHARVARIRAHQHCRALGLCAAGGGALPPAPRRRPRRARLRRRPLHHAVQLRRGFRRHRLAHPHHDG